MFTLYLSPSFQRNIPDPELGDVATTTLDRINRRTRGNDLIIRDVGHRNRYLRRYTWKNLCDPDFDWLQEFVKKAAGNEVILTTHYGEVLDALLVNPEAEMVQNSINQRSVTLDFLVTQ
jgi:hypothetical protein